MSQFTIIPCIKFEVLIPATYVDPVDPTGAPQFVQTTEVVRYLADMTAKYEQYGGYTISNPFAPPPFAGGYQGGPLERSFWVILIIPDHLLNQAEQDVQDMVALFQEQYHQVEILTYSQAVNRYVPVKS